MAVRSLIEKKLEQPASKSKKALYAGLAGLGVVIVFLLASALILKHAEVAKEIVELATTAIMAFMALSVTLITGQSAFDWKAVSALQHISEDEKIDSNAEAPEVEVNQRCWKAKYFQDHNDGIL
jgi:heme/copper-type cytochrome/quinol oxidase subunit 2